MLCEIKIICLAIEWIASIYAHALYLISFLFFINFVDENSEEYFIKLLEKSYIVNCIIEKISMNFIIIINVVFINISKNVPKWPVNGEFYFVHLFRIFVCLFFFFLVSAYGCPKLL